MFTEMENNVEKDGIIISIHQLIGMLYCLFRNPWQLPEDLELMKLAI